mmetsp:Transcript_2949/g.4545  ORF Transcript_2949/g.4545 Transcript_2949/m.4545 type:complete len:158 (-) Transcript_2949:325-798(-)|eukprot:CAMPEP_0175000658 /NCGR_PEP_ID=MMETSP0005-20121125/2710_1 /TAXON_ID=420556 /ORGANISM="Ochromonas sp., Strain CCMP1393" /LENGTH=157 /DNA_ID=CAMNT_0016255477 /DNA_START=21 /DNA_END=494 /DNA_ORIENTATION=-
MTTKTLSEEDRDPWDDVLNLESEIYHAGRVEGEASAKVEQEYMKDGFKAGFLRGYAVGLEVGFVETVVSDVLIEEDGDKSGKDLPNRTSKRCTELIGRCRNLPTNNTASASLEIDFFEEVRQIRAMYKLTGNKVGNFMPVLPSSNSTGTANVQSQQW